MIKVNLKKTKTSLTAPHGGRDDSDKMDFSTVMTTMVKEWVQFDISAFNTFVIVSLLLKLGAVCLFPLGLYIYEGGILNQLETDLQNHQKVHQSKQQRLSKLNQELDSQSYLKDKATEYNKKKEFLKGVSRSRLIVPEILDQIQSIIPESIWLKSIRLSIDKKGTIQITGESVSEDLINVFADELKTIVDRSSIKVDMNDIKQNDSFVKVQFNLSAVLLKRRNF